MTDVSGSGDTGQAVVDAAAVVDLAAAPAVDPAAVASEPKGWLDGIEDPELKAWATNKQFPDAKTALESYRGLEKLLGSDKVPLPKDENDKEGWDRFYKAAGRPDSPDGYKIAVPEGMDPEFAKDAMGWFHGAGLGGRQAEAVTARWNAWVDGKIKAEQAAFQAQSQADLGDLETEWGPKADANKELARRTASQFGIDKDVSAAMEHAMGTKAYLGLMVKIGQGLGEAEFLTGDVKGFTNTQAGAQARITQLMGDQEWSKSYLSGDKTKLAEMERLQKVAYPGMQDG